MSIRIIKSGALDTIQDEGRYGYQHLGINPSGVMDNVAMRIVNALVGNQPKEAVLEMHYPAPSILFEKDVLIALSGADFGATVNGEEVERNQPLIIDKSSILRFEKKKAGSRCYLAVYGGFLIEPWLGSNSTHMKIEAGGFHGRPLRKEDVVPLKSSFPYHYSGSEKMVALPWRCNIDGLYLSSYVRFLAGHEFPLLMSAFRHQFQHNIFTILSQSDRMGYRLKSTPIELERPVSLISTGVTEGTIQLLPDGQLIVLMADHQTTGGYPRVGQVISADIPSLAQMSAGQSFQLLLATIEEAESLGQNQQMHLQQLQNACNFRLREYFSN